MSKKSDIKEKIAWDRAIEKIDRHFPGQEFIKLSQVETFLGVSRKSVLQLCQDKCLKLANNQIGGMMVTRTSLVNYVSLLE